MPVRRSNLLPIILPVFFCTPLCLWSATANPQSLKIRLQTPLSSYESHEGSQFTAAVIAPYESNGMLLVPAGSIVTGTVGQVRAVGWGLVRERARMELLFREYVTPDGERHPLSARLESIDNAREQVNAQGQIKGILAARNPNGLVAGFWRTPSPGLLYRSLIGFTGTARTLNAALEMGPIGAAALFALRCSVIPFPEPEIQLPAGTEMKVKITAPPDQRGATAIPQPTGLSSSLISGVRDTPRGITKSNGHPASDIINVVFLGSREQLVNAFNRAGWSPAEATTLRSFSRTYAAFSSMAEYSTAPVSKLLYQGAEPGLVFQKSFNTVSKRDHVRIWYGGTFGGQDAWPGAATHDTGVVFRPRAMKFSHRIDAAIDVEQRKIVDDLAYAGCSQPASFINSPLPPGPSGKADLITSDGRIAIVPLAQCQPGSRLDPPGEMTPPGRRAKRLVRRIVLETRYYLLRENAYYWAYELIRWHGGQSVRAKESD